MEYSRDEVKEFKCATLELVIDDERYTTLGGSLIVWADGTKTFNVRMDDELISRYHEMLSKYLEKAS